jgi:hypothetical protein
MGMDLRRSRHQVFFQFICRRKEHNIGRSFRKGHDPQDRERSYPDVHKRRISCICRNASERIWIQVHKTPEARERPQSRGAYGPDDRSQLRAGREDQGRPETSRCGKEGHIRFRGQKTYEHLDRGTHESVHKDVSGAFQEEDAVLFEGHRDDEGFDRPVQDRFQFLFRTWVAEQKVLRERSETDGHAGDDDGHHR